MMSKIFDGMKLRLCRWRAANQHFITTKLRYLPLDHNDKVKLKKLLCHK